MAAVLSPLLEAEAGYPGAGRDCGRKMLRALGGCLVAEAVAWWISFLWRRVEWVLGGRSRVGRGDSSMRWWLR